MAHSRPLAIDLFTGLHGWAEGLVAEGYDVIGFDLEDMCGQFGVQRPAHVQLVIQDVLTLHGLQFKDAALIVASPPCQEYSYMAMPWARSKQIAAALAYERARPDGPNVGTGFPEGYTGSRTIGELNALFNACFRIQREACEAAGRHIPLIVENVRGAQPWVGRARWSYGSFYLWGDVPALMPVTFRAQKNPGFRFDGSGRSFQSESVDRHVKNPGLNWSAYREPDYRSSGKGACFRDTAIKNNGGSWFNVAHNTTSGKGNNPDGRKVAKDALGGYGGDFGWDDSPMRRGNSKSPARKFASAMIAKIPLPLSRWIARSFRPTEQSRAA